MQFQVSFRSAANVHVNAECHGKKSLVTKVNSFLVLKCACLVVDISP